MGLLDYIYPKKCLSCNKTGSYVCPNCLGKMGKTSLFCVGCLRPSRSGHTHIKCNTLLLLDRQFSLWKYEGVIRKILLKLKYQFVSDMAEELIENFIKDIDKGVFPKNSLVVPIPMHKKRKKWRGFNQAEELGRILAEKLNLEFAPEFLKRTKHVSPQTELKGDERRKNMKGVFSVDPDHVLKPKISTLILFDDVWTTGSTLKEATATVKRKHKKLNVIGMTICR